MRQSVRNIAVCVCYLYILVNYGYCAKANEQQSILHKAYVHNMHKHEYRQMSKGQFINGNWKATAACDAAINAFECLMMMMMMKMILGLLLVLYAICAAPRKS